MFEVVFWHWIGVAALFLIIELFSFQLTFVAFAVGALGAACVAYLGAPFVVALAIFAILPCIGIYFLHKRKKPPIMAESVECPYTGKIARVVEWDMTGAQGRVSLADTFWPAASPSSAIAVGENVLVTGWKENNLCLSVTPLPASQEEEK